MARTLTARLHQIDGPKGVRLFEVFDHRFLRVRQTNGQNALRDYAMDLAILAPTGRTEHRDDRHWLWLTAATVTTLLLSLAALFLDLASPLLLLPLAGVLLAVSTICVAQFQRSRRHLLVFTSRYAAVPLVELLINQPEQASYTAFITALSADIENRERSRELTPADLRAGELRSLRKLLEQQIIDPDTYTAAKQHLLTVGS